MTQKQRDMPLYDEDERKVLTVQQVIDLLQNIKNKDACFVICVDDWEYAGTTEIFDETTEDSDCIGVAGIKLDPTSTIYKHLVPDGTDLLGTVLQGLEDYNPGISQYRNQIQQFIDEKTAYSEQKFQSTQEEYEYLKQKIEHWASLRQSWVFGPNHGRMERQVELVWDVSDQLKDIAHKF